jgi:hypothetical protein
MWLRLTNMARIGIHGFKIMMDNKKFNESIFRIMRNRVKIDRDTLLHLIKKYEELLFPLYETMEAYCDEKNPRMIPDKSSVIF